MPASNCGGGSMKPKDGWTNAFSSWCSSPRWNRPMRPASSLLEAMRMAAPERIIQPFCQVGQPVIVMAADIARTHRALRPFAREIRERFATLPKFADVGTVALPVGAHHLTQRELEVLHLLDGHDSLADIAARLHVSINTIKVHTRHLYEKLGVGFAARGPGRSGAAQPPVSSRAGPQHHRNTRRSNHPAGVIRMLLTSCTMTQ